MQNCMHRPYWNILMAPFNNHHNHTYWQAYGVYFVMSLGVLC